MKWEWGICQLRNVKCIKNLVGKSEGKNVIRDLKIEDKIILERSLEKGTRFIVFCAS